jgi:UDP-glucose 4-epimerase
VKGADAVVHLAGANEVASAADPQGSYEATLAASKAIARACADLGVPRLIYVSTFHVYGSSIRPGEVVDELTSGNPLSAYAAARLASEDAVLEFSDCYEATVFRLTNSVGAPANAQVDRRSLVAIDLCRQASSGGPLRLKSDGRQWRDFVGLADVCDILIAATGGSIPPGTYNLGSGHSTRIVDLAVIVAQEAEACGLKRPEIVPGRASHGSGGPFTISIEKLKSAGFGPSTPLPAAITETLQFFVSNR